jgi:hypothetical protein
LNADPEFKTQDSIQHSLFTKQSFESMFGVGVILRRELKTS